MKISLKGKKTAWVNSPVKACDYFYSTLFPKDRFYALGLQGDSIIACSDADNTLRRRFPQARPDLFKKIEDWQGVNPFYETQIRFSNYDIENILSLIGFDRRMKHFKDGKDKTDEIAIPYSNFNPYFIIEGKQFFYQRGYVWTLEQKQALIDTIYRGLEAGRIIVATHTWDEQIKMIQAGYTDYAARDIVDGKQRLSTVIDFISMKFADSDGNYFSDLSTSAQRKFMQYSGFSYGEMNEHCTPKQIVEAFINNVSAGTPISKEHVEYMLKIKKMVQ